MLNLILLQAAGQQGSQLGFWLMMILIFVVFYFFMIRPQQKKQKESFGFGNFSGDVFGLSLKKPNKKSKKIFDWL